MSGCTTQPGSWWDHREARWVEQLASPPSGRDGPATRASADRAAPASGAEAFGSPATPR